MDNKVQKDEKVVRVPEIKKLVRPHYYEDRTKKALLSMKGLRVVNEEIVKDFLNELIDKLNNGIEYCKKYFCTLLFGSLQDIISKYTMAEYITVEMMPVKVILDNETKIYVDVDVYVGDYFIIGREYNKMHDAYPSEGPEYNIIFSEDVLNSDKDK